MHGLGNGRIGQQGVDAAKDRIELRQHLFYLRNHVGSLSQSTFLLGTADSVARSQTRCRSTQPQFQFHIAKKVAAYLCRRTLWQEHVLGDAHLGDDIVRTCIVIVDTFDDTDLITVGIDRTGRRKTTDIVEMNEIAVV